MADQKEGKAKTEPKPKAKLSLEVLSKQIEELRAAIDGRFTNMGESFGGFVQQQVDGVTAKLTERIEKIENEIAEIKAHGGKDRGPKSTREMTEHDAWRVRFGDLKDMSIKKAAEALGLSYGQVYSAKGEYTFKGLSAKPKPEWTKS